MLWSKIKPQSTISSFILSLWFLATMMATHPPIRSKNGVNYPISIEIDIKPNRHWQPPTKLSWASDLGAKFNWIQIYLQPEGGILIANDLFDLAWVTPICIHVWRSPKLLRTQKGWLDEMLWLCIYQYQWFNSHSANKALLA